MRSEEKLCTFIFNNCSSIVDLGAELKTYQIALSPLNNKFAIATSKHLVITDDRDYSILADSPSPKVDTLLEFSNASGRCTALLWLNNEIICLGFESGEFAVFSSDGKGLVEQRCHTAAVQSLKVSEGLLPGIYGSNAQSSSYAGLLLRSMGAGDPADGPASGTSLWILHENGMVAVVPVDSLLQGDFGELIRFQLLNTATSNDLILLPTPRCNRNPFVTVTEDDVIFGGQSMLVGGLDATLSLYRLGGPQHFEHFGKFAEYVKSRTVGLVSRTLLSFFQTAEPSSGHVDLTKAPIVSATSMLDFADSGRKVLRMSLDPTNCYVAVADSMGRVTLFDVLLSCIVRIWKGVRDARVGWAERCASVPEGSVGTNAQASPLQPMPQMTLAVYAPRLGLLTFYDIPQGRRLRVVPVGLQCHIMTLMLVDEDVSSTERKACCVVLSASERGDGVELSVVSPEGRSEGEEEKEHDESFSVPTSPGMRSSLLPTPPQSPHTSASPLMKRGQFTHDALVVRKAQAPMAHSPDDVSKEETIMRVKRRPSLSITVPAPVAESAAESEPDVQAGASDFDEESAIFTKVCLLLVKLSVSSHDPSPRDALEVRLRDFLATVYSLPLCLRILSMVQDIEMTPVADADLPTGIGNRPLSRAGSLSHAGSFLGLTPSAGSLVRTSSFSSGVTSPAGRLGQAGASTPRMIGQRSGSVIPTKNGAEETPIEQKTFRRLSPRVHDLICKMLEQVVATCERGTAPAAAATLDHMRHEAVVRRRLLSAYHGLQELARSAAPIPSLRDLQENIPSVCRAGGLRGEALSYALRALRNSGVYEAIPDNTGHGSQSHSPPPATATQSSSVKAASIVRHMSELASVRDSLAESPAATASSLPRSFPLLSRSDSFRGDVQALARSQSFISVNSSRASFDVSMADAAALEPAAAASLTNLPFSMFRAFFSCRSSRSTHICLRQEVIKLLCSFSFSVRAEGATVDLLAALQTVDEASTRRFSHSCSTTEINTLLEAETFCAIPAAALSCFLALLANPLLQDASSLPQASCAFILLGQVGPHGLRDLLLLTTLLSSLVPLSSSMTRVLLRSASDSCLQRWLRDSLMSLFEQHSGLGGKVRMTLGASGNASTLTNYGSDEDGDDDESLAEVTRDAIKSPKSSAVDDEELTAVRAFLHEISPPRAPGMDDGQFASLPNFDTLVKAALEPTYEFLRDCAQLEVALALCAAVCETLDAVGVQVEKRSSRRSSLQSTHPHWRKLFRRLRVTVLLQSRSAGRLTVRLLEHGADPTGQPGGVSIYRLLADDTLSFAMKADGALAHEARCLETIQKKIGVSATGSVSGEEGVKPLQAYGATADSRWAELLALVEADDVCVGAAGESSSTKGSLGKREGVVTDAPATRLRRRRPLLLLFPQHISTESLCCHRAVILADRWRRLLSSTHLLLLSPSHIRQLADESRAAVAADILLRVVLPLVGKLLLLEEPDLNSMVRNRSGEEVAVQLVSLLSDSASAGKADEFANGALELLRYTDGPRIGTEWIDNYSRARGRAESALSDVEKEAVGAAWPGEHDAYLEWAVSAHIRGPLNDGGANARACTAVLLMLHMRCTRRLRGVRPSQLFDIATLQGVLQLSSVTCEDQIDVTLVQEQGSPLDGARREFLRQCMDRSKTPSEAEHVYRLGAYWGFNEAIMQCMHFPLLLERGADAEVLEAVKALRADETRPYSSIVEALRKRVGSALARIDGLPAYGALLASVDQDFIQWALSVAEPVEPAVQHAVQKKLAPAVEINVASTMQLVKTLATVMLKHESDMEIERFGTLAKRCEVLRILLGKILKSAAL